MDLQEIEGQLEGNARALEVVTPKRKRRGHKEEPEQELSRRAREFAHILEAEKCDPAVTAARICNGKIICHVCMGKAKLRYRRTREGRLIYDPDPNCRHTVGLQPCLHCKGSGKEPLEPNLILNAALGLLPYRWPRLKHMEHIKANLNLTGSMTVVELAELLTRIPEEGGKLKTPPQIPEGENL